MRFLILAACLAALVILAGCPPAIAADAPSAAVKSAPVAPPATTALPSAGVCHGRFPRVWRVLHPFEGRLQCRFAYFVRRSGACVRWAVCGR